MLCAESPSFQTRRDEDEHQSFDENVTKITESIKDTSLDILDDSSNELMILCSQAVEESISVASNENPKPSVTEKHPITPDHDRNASKRFKSQITPKDVFKNHFHIDSRLNNLNQKSCISRLDNFPKKQSFQRENSVLKNQERFKPPPPTYINSNNSTNLKNFNKNVPNFGKFVNTPQLKKPVVSESSIESAITPLRSQSVAGN